MTIDIIEPVLVDEDNRAIPRTHTKWIARKISDGTKSVCAKIKVTAGKVRDSYKRISRKNSVTRFIFSVLENVLALAVWYAVFMGIMLVFVALANTSLILAFLWLLFATAIAITGLMMISYRIGF